MWLLDVFKTKPSREHLVCVITRNEVLIYAGHPSRQLDGWRLLARQQFDGPAPSSTTLQATALKAFSSVDNSPSRLTVLLDSYWAPVSLIAVGRSVLKSAEVQALAKHRFKSYFGPSVDQWALQIDYRAGYLHALACGLPTHILDTVRNIARQSLNVQLTSVTSTLIWALSDAQRSSSKLNRDGWVAVAESDRTVVAHISRGQVVSLHPAAPILQGADGLPDMVAHGAQTLGEHFADQPIAGYCFAPSANLASCDASGTGWSWHVCRQSEAA